MKRSNTLQRIQFILVTAFITATLVGCDGDQGSPGAAAINTTTASNATSLAITIDGVSINSAPIVDFSASDQDGVALAGLTTSDLRFTIAKLVPGSLGDASAWQNYINQESDGGMRGSQERNRDGYPLGVLVDNNDGSYSYTFETNLDEAAANCPAPCTDADGKPLDISYDPALTHRVVIQLSHSSADLPPLNAVYTFRPSDGVTDPSMLFSREIVKTESCNECHNQLSVHGPRVEVQYCVMCHNPGTWDGENGNTADFKVMIHKIHRGHDLPSVGDGTPYEIGGHDYSTVHYPQDIRHCSKCHDGADTDTLQGDNWKTELSMEACGSCHDDKDFSKDGTLLGDNDPLGHSGGIMTDNSLCSGCHAEGKFPGSVAAAHLLQEPIARQKFKLNILEICGVAVGSDPGPLCAPTVRPSVKFSITDPTNGDAEYNLNTTPEITGSNLSFLVAWSTSDYNNAGGSGTRPARADSIDFDEAGFVDATTNPLGYIDDGTTQRTVTAPVKAPVDFVIPLGTEGSGAVGAQGRLAGDFNDDGTRERSERIYLKNEVAFFRITDTTVVERRPTVDNAKCNQCHDQVVFHGGSRSGEYGVCILCHNPNNTDIDKRPVDPNDALDLKAEDSIDLRRMIHGIHASAQTNYDGSEGHGFREQGLVLYGHNNNEHDYSHVRFPGILQDCETCHISGAYLLDGKWEDPTANGILSSTIDTGLLLADPGDDLNISPTAAVCSSCHDSDVARAHMEVPGGAVFNQDQDGISTTPVVETCSVCHGPGRDTDVERVHAER